MIAQQQTVTPAIRERLEVIALYGQDSRISEGLLRMTAQNQAEVLDGILSQIWNAVKALHDRACQEYPTLGNKGAFAAKTDEQLPLTDRLKSMHVWMANFKSALVGGAIKLPEPESPYTLTPEGERRRALFREVENAQREDLARKIEQVCSFERSTGQ